MVVYDKRIEIIYICNLGDCKTILIKSNEIVFETTKHMSDNDSLSNDTKLQIVYDNECGEKIALANVSTYATTYFGGYTLVPTSVFGFGQLKKKENLFQIDIKKIINDDTQTSYISATHGFWDIMDTNNDDDKKFIIEHQHSSYELSNEALNQWKLINKIKTNDSVYDMMIPEREINDISVSVLSL